MMMAENATDGKLEKLLGAATDLFDYVRRAAEEGEAIHEVEEGIWQRMLQLGHDASASSSNVKETEIWARR